MELLLILIYTAICAAVFKIFRIPVNKWTLPKAKVQHVIDAIALGQLQATGSLQEHGSGHTRRAGGCDNRY